MNNQQTIQEIQEKFDAAIKPIEDYAVRKEIAFKDIDIFEGNLYYHDYPMSAKAQNKILSELQVKKGFVNYANKMEESDWKSISSKLKNVQGDRTIFAHFEKDSRGNEFIENVFSKNPKKKKADPQDYDFFIESITDALGESDISYDLGSFNFNPLNRTFDLSLLDRKSSIDIFKNGKDIWDGGHSFRFNPTSFQTSPFFERLICTNGMRSRQNMFDSRINQSRFNVEKISKLIKTSIVNGSSSLNESIMLKARHLADNNISINEFNKFRKLFITSDEDKITQYDKIREKFFNEKPFYQAYQINIAEKSNKWKTTADTGINAYQFFNMITWLGSHKDEVGIDDKMANSLQLRSSDLFFKDKLDLEDIAKPVGKIEYPTEHIAFE